MFARLFLLSTLIACAGCDDSAAPSESTPKVTGTWTGMIGSAMSGSAVRLTWTASQAGAGVLGVARLVKPAIGTEMPGTLSGLIAGDQIGLKFTSGRLAVPSVPDCVVFGDGSGTIRGNTITGTFSLTAMSCAAIGIESLTDAPLFLTR
jgi:hypothetical protein